MVLKFKDSKTGKLKGVLKDTDSEPNFNLENEKNTTKTVEDKKKKKKKGCN